MRRICWWIAGSMAFALAAGSAAHAAVVQMEMTGTITIVDDSLGLLPFAHIGDQVVYRFSYDSETPYSHILAGYPGISATLQAGSQSLIADAPVIYIQHPNDLFDVSSHLANTGLSQDLRIGYAYFRLSDQVESNALTNTDLPLVPYDLTAFSTRSFHVSFIGPGGENGTLLYFSGTIDSFVPEPTTLGLLTIGGVLFLRRPRSTRTLA